MPAPEALDRERIRCLIPHEGAMCLLDRVAEWDETSIRCYAASHRRADHPLRARGRLPIEAGIEYAAQAMAVHGGLGGAGAAPRKGFIAVLNRVLWQAERLDDRSGELCVRAWLVQGGDDGRQYGFCLEHDGETLIEGEALVMLDTGPTPDSS